MRIRLAPLLILGTLLIGCAVDEGEIVGVPTRPIRASSSPAMSPTPTVIPTLAPTATPSPSPTPTHWVAPPPVTSSEPPAPTPEPAPSSITSP